MVEDSRRRILIVDDDPDIVEAMRLVLEAKGYQIEVARQGVEGLQKVKVFDPALIILDVMMKDLTEGFHVAYQLRNRDPRSPYARWVKVPILMITAVHQVLPFRYSKDTDEDFLPVDEFIDKPIQPDQLLSVVKKYLPPGN